MAVMLQLGSPAVDQLTADLIVPLDTSGWLLAIIRLMFDIVDSVTSRISHTTIDSRNAYQQSLWWSKVLSMREDPEDPNEPGHEECMIFSTDGRTRLLFIEVPEAKQVKNRIHFDLRPTNATREEEVSRLFAVDRGALPGQWVHAARRAALVSRIRAW
jgi:hypothetical protein